MKTSRTETLELIIFITLFTQLFCGMILFFWGFNQDYDLNLRIILAAELPMILVSFLVFGVMRYMTSSEQEKRHEEQETRFQLEQSSQLIESLEAQRHDFRNQLQVIRTLAAMNKTEEIQAYIDECGTALNTIAGLNRIDNAVIKALFLAFQSKIWEREIRFEVNCQADLRNFPYSSLKISRILANLLENAAEAVAQERETPTISVAIWQDEVSYQFVFWNNGPPIPPGDLPFIFQSGFTKKAPGRGYGLHIVQTLTMELGGTITVESAEEEGTEFRLSFPLALPRNKNVVSGLETSRK